MWMFCKHLLPPIGHHHLQLHFLECNKWRVNSYLSYAPIVDKLEHMQLQLSSVMQVGQHQNLQECLRRKERHNQPKLKDFKLSTHLTSILHSEPCGETFFAGNLVFDIFIFTKNTLRIQSWNTNLESGQGIFVCGCQEAAGQFHGSRLQKAQPACVRSDVKLLNTARYNSEE